MVVGTEIRHFDIVIARHPQTANGLYLKVGSAWLNLFTSDIAAPEDASVWAEFCEVLDARNKACEGNFSTRGPYFSFSEDGQDFLVNIDAIMSAEARLILPGSQARRGSKPCIKGAVSLPVATGDSAKDSLIAIDRGKFRATGDGDGVLARVGNTTVYVKCDEAIGFGALRALEMLAACGPGMLQTFLGLMGLWIERNVGASHETYFTVRVSDLMRYMHRTEANKAGYNMPHQIKKGHEVFVLSRITMLGEKETQYTCGGISVGKIMTLTFQTAFEGPKEIQSMVEFRYHPNREIYEMLAGSAPQFAEVGGKLLSYHPVSEKYHIMIGFGLAYYDSVSQKLGSSKREIGLVDLLRLAGIEIPRLNVARLYARIEVAFEDLKNDGVIPGVKLIMPTCRTMSLRKKIEAGTVTLPAFAPSRRLQEAGATGPSSHRLTSTSVD